MSRTRAAALSTNGVLLFWALTLAAGTLVPGYSDRQDYVSSLAGRGSSVAALGIIGLAALGLAHLGAAWTLRGRIAVPLALAGIAGLTIAAFRVGCPLDAAGCSFTPGNRIGDLQSSVHGLAVALYQAALMLAMLGTAIYRRAKEKVFALVSAFAAPVSLILLLATGGADNGWWQRAWLVVNTAWLVALVWRARPPGRPRRRAGEGSPFILRP